MRGRGVRPGPSKRLSRNRRPTKLSGLERPFERPVGDLECTQCRIALARLSGPAVRPERPTLSRPTERAAIRLDPSSGGGGGGGGSTGGQRWRRHPRRFHNPAAHAAA